MDWTTLTGELNLEALSEQIEQLFPNFSIDFSSLLGQILSGNAKEAFAGLAASLKNGVLAEMAGMKNLLLTLLIIGVLSALFTVVMQSFDNHQIADIAHFISYLLMLFVVLRTFTQAADIAGELLGRILLFVRLFVPTFMLALGLSAGAATAAGYYQLILLLIYGVEQVLKSIGLPAVNIYMMLVVMNGIWEEERLGMLVELLQKGVAGFLKFLLTCITGIGLLQSMVTPVLEHLKLKCGGQGSVGNSRPGRPGGGHSPASYRLRGSCKKRPGRGGLPSFARPVHRPFCQAAAVCRYIEAVRGPSGHDG